jgi:histone deacetylase complex regulatory component SIN3
VDAAEVTAAAEGLIIADTLQPTTPVSTISAPRISSDEPPSKPFVANSSLHPTPLQPITTAHIDSIAAITPMTEVTQETTPTDLPSQDPISVLNSAIEMMKHMSVEAALKALQQQEIERMQEENARKIREFEAQVAQTLETLSSRVSLVDD